MFSWLLGVLAVLRGPGPIEGGPVPLVESGLVTSRRMFQ